MNGSIDTASARARCLAELAEALSQAQALLEDMAQRSELRSEMIEIAGRIETVRMETLSLRLAWQPRPRKHPEWTDLPPWSASG